MTFRTLILATALICCAMMNSVSAVVPTAWVKHTIVEAEACQTAVAGDFTGDAKIDVISNSGGKCHLMIAPDWKHVVLYENRDHSCIHSEVFDIDGDGDLDYLAARYNPGLIFWLENNGTTTNWPWHLVDDQVHGIHGLLRGDVDQDGTIDLIANSAQPLEPFPESIVWYSIPQGDPHQPWEGHVLADQDAPGLSHYMGFGYINADGRPDVLSAAKGGPQAQPGAGDWYAWWEAPAHPRQRGWKKHLIADQQSGATNLHPADVDGDGITDVVASRGHGFGLCWFKGPNWKRTDFGNELEGPHCLALADFDGDGDLDAATTAKDSKVTAWFANDGQGGFTMHRLDDDQAAYDIRAIDLDGDGDTDLLVAGQTSKTSSGMKTAWDISCLKRS